jgi:hypothetical protein
MGSSLGIGVSSEGYPRRALHVSAIASGTSSQRRTGAGPRSTWHRKAGRVRWGYVARPWVPHWYVGRAGPRWARHAAPRYYEDGRARDHGSSPSAGSRKDRGCSNDRAQTIATSAITRRWPFGPGTRRCCRRCIPVWGRSNLASRRRRHFSRKLPPRANWNQEHARLERKLTNERNVSPVKKAAGKIAKVMGKCERGTLHSGSKKGPAVENPK